jgi:threonylcarbamoyladenosine tRNA methylthiotransferase MtaB
MKVYLRTYGCRANQYDTEAVRAMVVSSGAQITDDIADADFAVFNSCTVTSAAEADLRADVRAASRANPELRSIVMGCAPGVPNRNESIAPLQTLPGVDAIIAGADIDAVSSVLGMRPHTRFAARQTGARALLRIQDGCDEHCTFCATTIARGANRSRSVRALVDEAARLAETHPEIVITGIHIGSYGKDVGESLSSLVATLLDEVATARFRLTSIEATEVDESLAQLLLSDSSRLAPHLHAPLQSGSDPVLRRMGRNWYTARSYRDAIRRIVRERAVFALSADVITGFPGETDADHAATLAIIDELPFTSLHVFPYSPRPGTAALKLGSAVAGSVARRRSRELRALADDKAATYRKARVGGTCDVVVIERGKGLTEDYLSVDVPESIPRRSRFRATLREAEGRLIAFSEAAPG